MKKLSQPRFYLLGLIIGLFIALLIGLTVFIFSNNKQDKAANTPSTSQPKYKQTVGKCEPKDEHQWYRTDSTFVINPKNPDIMYVNVEYKGFFKSIDGGKTWIKKINGIFSEQIDEKTGQSCILEFPAAVIDPTNPDRLLLATSGSPGTLKDMNSHGGGIYETTDGGENWEQKIRDDMNAYSTQSLVLDPQNPNIYYYGTSASPASYDGADQSKIFVSKGIIYRTKNNGKDWDELPTGFAKNARLSKIFIDQKNSNRLVALAGALNRHSDSPSEITTEQMGVLGSGDQGNTWKRIDSLKSPYDAAYAGDMAPTNGQNIFMVALTQGGEIENKSFYTTDGGTTFLETGRYIDFAKYDPNDPNGNTLIGYNWQSKTGQVSTLFKSTDAGKTWSAWGTLPQEARDLSNHKTRIQNLVWHPIDPKSFFLTGAGGLVWKTVDYGQTWTKLLSYDML